MTGQKTANTYRFPEVDVARGLAIIAVVLYHFVYDLDALAGYGIESTSGFWGFFADASAFAFVFLAGLSLAISSSRARVTLGTGWELYKKYLFRGLRILGYGMLITLVFWVLQFGTVIFGILHLIGVSIILSYPFLKLRWPNLFLGLAIIALGAFMQALNVSADTAWLAPLGVVPDYLFMPDYRPLLPWFGVVLLGLFAGNMLYADRAVVRARTVRAPAPVRPLAFLGRHTLLIYLVHQPLLISVLAVLGVVTL